MSFAILAATALSFLLEASPSPSASPDAIEALKHATKDYPQLASLVGVLIAAVGIITYLKAPAETLQKITESLQKTVEAGKKIVGTVRASQEAPKQMDDLRQKLLKAIKRDVTQRLTDNLFDQFVIPLEMQNWNPAVGRAAALPLAPEAEAPKPQNPLLQVMRRLRIGKQPEKEIPPSRSLLDVFNQPDVAGKLLILGEPGSGKTTLLLDLAKALLTHAEQLENKLIPVIFELSNWKDDRQPIDQWLVAQLKENYNLAPAVSQQWLTSEQLLPLLDGLDELGMTRQIKCVEAINQFLQPMGTHYPHLVVCCRKEEYDEGKVTLHELNGAIYLQALTDAQIQQYLQAAKRPTLWQTIQAEPDLRRLLERQDDKPAVLRTPLLLKMLVVAYQGRTIRNTQELFDAYIDHQFALPLDWKAYPKGKAPYSRPQTIRYLVWLARTLKAEAKTEFLIEKMQPTLLETAKQRWLYRLVDWLVSGLVSGLVIGLFSVLFSVLFFGPVSGLVSGLFLGLVFGLFLGLVSGLVGGPIDELVNRRESIELTEAFQISMTHDAGREIVKDLWQGLVAGLVLGLVFGLVSGLVLGLVYGLVLGLVYGLVSGLLSGLRADIQTRSTPNQGIWQSAWNIIPATLLSLPAGVFLVLLPIWLSGNPVHWLSLLLGNPVHWLSLPLAMLFFSLLIGISFSSLPVIQHVALRFVLWNWKQGSIPWNYAKFLQYANDRRLIQQVGGRYRFLHDLLREHFAEMRE